MFVKKFFSRWLIRPLSAVMARLRRFIPPVIGARRGRWLSGDYSNIKGALFYAPFHPPRRSYRLYMPAKYDGVSKVPLVVMLHGCGQGSKSFAAGTRMNRIADASGFLVLYPEQEQWANKFRCWNWFDPVAQNGNGEALLIAGMIRKVIDTYAVDPDQVYVAGLSAGGAMASILASCYGDLFAACAIHSGLTFRAAGSSTEATRAMKHGSLNSPENTARLALRGSAQNGRPIPTIVFQGSADETVYPINADQVAGHFLKLAEYASGDRPTRATTQPTSTHLKNGGYAYHVSDHFHRNRLLLRKVVVEGMGHAWSGGDARHPFNDPKGPDASQMIWEFFSEFYRQREPKPAREKIVG